MVAPIRIALRAGGAAPRLPLKAVRRAMGKTQGDVAAALGTWQGEISRIERRDDVFLSTLRLYAEAVGARCEVAFVLPGGQRIVIAASEVSLPPRGPRLPFATFPPR